MSEFSLKLVLPKRLVKALGRARWNWRMNRGMHSYSQEGEDILLNKIFLEQKDGFYVDIGAHHPIHFSNTYLFYRHGWRGINIEPIPGAKRLFDRKRPHDVTLNIGIGTAGGSLPFYMFDNAVLNTFDAARMRVCLAEGAKLVRTADIEIARLDAVLDRHLPKNQPIDFMSIDVEGAEEGVVRSNDWSRFRPKILCIEFLETDVVEIPNHPVARLLASLDYVYFAKGDATSYFREKNFTY